MITRKLVLWLAFLALANPTISHAQSFLARLHQGLHGQQQAIARLAARTKKSGKFRYFNRLFKGYARGARFVVTEIVQLPRVLAPGTMSPPGIGKSRQPAVGRGRQYGSLPLPKRRSHLYINNSSSAFAAADPSDCSLSATTQSAARATTMMHEIGTT